MPVRTAPTPETLLALSQNMDGFDAVVFSVVGRSGREARNRLASEIARLEPSRFVLWVDDDGWWPAGTVKRFASILEARADVDILSAYYGVRRPFAGPLSRGPREADADGLRRVGFFGMQFVMHRVGLLARLGSEPFSSDEPHRPPADQAFCDNLFFAGIAKWNDTRSPVAHVEHGFAFLPDTAPGRIVDNGFALAEEFSGYSREEIEKRFRPERRTY